MQDEIKRILARELTVQAVSLVDISTETFFSINGIPAAAQAIAEFVAAQPMDRVRALAALTVNIPTNKFDGFYVGEIAEVWDDGDGLLCARCRADDCDHIRAAEMFRGMQGERDG